MASIFTRIIDGEIPARFVWSDDTCVAFLDARPIKPGHTLVVPRTEVDHWIDLDMGTWEHLQRVAKAIGAAQQRAFHPVKVGMMLAGVEVPHAHVHLVPISGEGELSFANADPNPADADLDQAAEAIRTALSDLGVAN